MAANFWDSSHCNHWIVDHATLEASRTIDSKYASKRQLGCLGIYFANLLQRLGKRLQLRQRPVATSIVYFRRFYLKNSYCETDPYLVLATCAYVAAKLEETPVHIKSVVMEARAIFVDLRIPVKHFPSDNNKLAEMEFYLLEDLDFHLTVFHPYRTLAAICGNAPADSGFFPEPDDSLKTMDQREEDDLNLGRGTGKGALVLEKEVFENAWFIVNDTYRSDLCLLYPPHLIAVACLFLAISHSQTAHPDRSTVAPPPSSTPVLPSATPLVPSSNSSSSLLPPAANATITSPRPRTPAPSIKHALPPNPLLHHSLPMNPLLAAKPTPPSKPTTPMPTYPSPSSSSMHNPTLSPRPPVAASPLRPPPPIDPIIYLSSLNVNFSLVARIAQEILSVWPLWDAMEKQQTSTSSEQQPADGKARVGGGIGVGDGADMVGLLGRMRFERDRDKRYPDGGWPVEEKSLGGKVAAGESVAGKSSNVAAGVKRGRG